MPVLLHEDRAFVVSPSRVQVIDLAGGRTVGEEIARADVLREDADGFVREAVSYGIDTASRALRWTQPGPEVVQAGAGMAVGLLHVEPLISVPLGVDLAIGTEKWRGEKTYAAIMNGAGPGTVRVAGPQVGDKGDQLLDVISRTPRATMPPGMRAMSCSYDRGQALVCTHGFAVVAVDTARGTLLWVLKDGDGDRKPQAVTAVWHGRVRTCRPSPKPRRFSPTPSPGWC
ncbi:hypothetical protein [Streptomyces sp. NBC_00105]|uniref:hypothetical protein n=1 Tax=Streptomyces sp. NBC_00105 TaxID=2903622 RepID=UPI00325673D1